MGLMDNDLNIATLYVWEEVGRTMNRCPNANIPSLEYIVQDALRHVSCPHDFLMEECLLKELRKAFDYKKSFN